MSKKLLVATIHFNEAGSEGLKNVLEGLVGRHFHYKDQDGCHHVELLSAGDSGLVTLIDRNKRTGEPLKDAIEYTVCLYTDGTLTYL
jgi:hypothetical protein